MRTASTIDVELGGLVEEAGRAPLDRGPDQRRLLEPGQEDDGRRAAGRSARDRSRVVERLEDAQPFRVAVELDVADQHVHVGRQAEGVVHRPGRADQGKVHRRLDRRGHGRQHGRVVVDDPDADPGRGPMRVRDGRSLQSGGA